MPENSKLRTTNKGQTNAEFALLLVFMSFVLILAVTLLGGEIEAFFDRFTIALSSAIGG